MLAKFEIYVPFSNKYVMRAGMLFVRNLPDKGGGSYTDESNLG